MSVEEFTLLTPEEVKKLKPAERTAYLRAKKVYDAQKGLAGATGSSSLEGAPTDTVLVNPTADKNGNEVSSKVHKAKERKARKEKPVRWEASVSFSMNKKARARVDAIKDEGLSYNRNALIAEALTYFLSNVPVNAHIVALEKELESA